MKTKKLIVVLLALAMLFAMTTLVFYKVTLVEDGFGLVYVTNDGKWKSCKEFEGLSIYPRNSDVYTYPTTVQKVQYGIPVITKDSIRETIYIDFDYQIENAVDFIQFIIKDIEHYDWSQSIHYIPETKEESERTFGCFLHVVSDSLARNYNLTSLATLEFEKELEEEFEKTIIKGIKVRSLRVSMGPEFNKLLKKRDDALEDIKKAEEALKRAEQEAEAARAEAARAKAEQEAQIKIRGKLVHYYRADFVYQGRLYLF